VLDSVKAHSKFIEPDFGYGYGWWISPADYQATGRGGQRVRVFASLNTLVIATGAYFDYGDVESWLLPILLNLKDTLPVNPEGLAVLEAALMATEENSVDWEAGSTS
jgi:CubicO group peptidase (beta-lactamase class C family)